MPAPTFFDLIKKNITALGAVITIVTALVGAVLTVESRYAKAGDLDGVKQYVIKSHEYTRYELRQSLDSDAKDRLEDQLFDLRSKKNPTPSEQAMIKRYEDRLNSVNQRLNQPAPQMPSMDVQQPAK